MRSPNLASDEQDSVRCNANHKTLSVHEIRAINGTMKKCYASVRIFIALQGVNKQNLAVSFSKLLALLH